MANSLRHAASSYLRAAADQPVAWRQWGEAAFAAARAENKPILLDIGAVWCHWCHVMDRESYEDAAVAEIINRHFVAIKVDRDERPDVDGRYQLAVSALSGQGGWPLTAFLGPEGEPFYGGTYFPPAEGHGRPSFRRVLESVAAAYREHPDQARATGRRVLDALSTMEFPAEEETIGAPRGFSPAVLEPIYSAALRAFDARNGGFGHAPKFPHPAILDWLLDRFVRRGDAVAGNIVFLTLDQMARGGVRDHLGGGFHRYSVDEHWGVPHFEKMAYDNSELLKNYVHAAQSCGGRGYVSVALEIARWADEVLSDRERGGFYASQDADISLHDDGDYFTWTREEARAVLEENEFALVAELYDLGERGPMHHNPAKNVLHLPAAAGAAAAVLEAFARAHKRTPAEAESLLARAQGKLRAARARRVAPFVDRTIYASWNALFISAYFELAKLAPLAAGAEAAATAAAANQPAGGERERFAAARAFALLSLDRMLAELDPQRGLRHLLFAAPDAETAGIEPPPPLFTLEDQVFPALAALDGWEATGEPRYFAAALRLGEIILTRYADAGGGFTDLPAAAFAGAARPGAGGAAPGALRQPRKPLQDSPTPSGNSAAVILFLRLHAFTEDARWREAAQSTLNAFAAPASGYGIFAGTYALAGETFLAPPQQIVVVAGADGRAPALAEEARAAYRLGKSVVSIAAGADAAALPASVRLVLENLPAARERDGESFALVCSGRSCLPPARDPSALRDRLAEARP